MAAARAPSPAKVLEAAIAATSAASEASKAAAVAASAATTVVEAARSFEAQLRGVSDRVRRMEEHREATDIQLKSVNDSVTSLNGRFDGLATQLNSISASISAAKSGARIVEWMAAIAIGLAAVLEILRHTS